MNSQKTKTNEYTIINGKAIAGVVVEPLLNGWAITVAWENPKAAADGFFALIYSLIENTDFSFTEAVCYTANFGVDVTHLEKYRKKFPNLF